MCVSVVSTIVSNEKGTLNIWIKEVKKGWIPPYVTLRCFIAWNHRNVCMFTHTPPPSLIQHCLCLTNILLSLLLSQLLKKHNFHSYYLINCTTWTQHCHKSNFNAIKAQVRSCPQETRRCSNIKLTLLISISVARMTSN